MSRDQESKSNTAITVAIITGLFGLATAIAGAVISNSSAETPAPKPPEITQPPIAKANGPIPLHMKVVSTDDSSRLYSFLVEHIGEVVELDVELISKDSGGITELDHTAWMEWIDGGRSNQTYDITMDKECPDCRSGIYDHLILRIENSGEYSISKDLVLSGVFVPALREAEAGQGYSVIYLVPSVR